MLTSVQVIRVEIMVFVLIVSTAISAPVLTGLLGPIVRVILTTVPPIPAIMVEFARTASTPSHATVPEVSPEADVRSTRMTATTTSVSMVFVSMVLTTSPATATQAMPADSVTGPLMNATSTLVNMGELVRNSGEVTR